MTEIKLIFTIIIGFILEIFIVCLSLTISILDQYKIKNLTSEIIKESFINLSINPIDEILGMLYKRNPVLIIGTIALFLFMIYVVYMSFCTQKNNYTNKK